MKGPSPRPPQKKKPRNSWLNSVPDSIRSVKRLRRYDMMRSEPVVYFLCDGNRLVKIGATQELPQAIASNRRRLGYDGITFDSVYYVKPPRPSLLFRVMRALIRHAKPETNRGATHAPDEHDMDILRKVL